MVPQETEPPIAFSLNGKQRTFAEIHNSFGATSWGEKLRNNIRYGTFKPFHLPNSEWEGFLGADVNNFEHLRLTYGLTRWFIANSPGVFSREEQELLLLTATVHDWGEAEVGDIPFPVKTQKEEEEEISYLEKFMLAFLGNQYRKTIDDVKGILSDKKSKLGRAFNAIEKVGYVRIGIRAWELSKKMDGALGKIFTIMGWDVGVMPLADLILYSQEFSPVFMFLQSHKDSISEILEKGKQSKYKDVDWFKKAESLWPAFGTVELPST